MSHATIMQTFMGIPASNGIAVGPIYCYRPTTPVVNLTEQCNPVQERARLKEALTAVDGALLQVIAHLQAADSAAEAEIFEFHRLCLEDPAFLEEVEVHLNQQQSAAAAVELATAAIAEQFAALEDDYFRQRATDVRDVGQRVINHLLGVTATGLTNLHQPVVVWADDLTPSDTAMLDRALVLGLCTAQGSTTSHTAILARSLGIPAVVGVQQFAPATDEMLILDGASGHLILNPDEATLAYYRDQQASQQQQHQAALAHAHEPAYTQDGVRVEVGANIGSVAEAEQALVQGAEGVGLLRTEFLFLDRPTLPSEEEQYTTYRAIADRLHPFPLIIRTLDVGGDKPLPSIELPAEENPFLGVRAIRLCLSRPELFQPQLRAILRAADQRKVKVMFPMVSSVEEVLAARHAIAQAAADLTAAGVAHATQIEIGIMVEIPAVALLIDGFAPYVDFFSIGTNDLTQYTLAADRTNPGVAHLADALHPAVVRLIDQIIERAHAHNKWVGMCGEMAGNPLAIPLLLGLGLDEFSMGASAIPAAKAQLRTLTQAQARIIAQQCLQQTERQAVLQVLLHAIN